MNSIWYIARKIGFGQGARFTRFMLGLGTVSIALSIAIMILANAITNGFQHQITQKIYDFWGHIHISSGYTNKFFETEAITLDSILLEEIRDLDLTKQGAAGKVRSVDGIIQYPVILQQNDLLEGAIIRSLDSTYRYDVMDQYMVEGSLDSFQMEERSVMLSRSIQRKMDAEVGDRIILYFIKDDQQLPRRFRIRGIYNTGVMEYDDKIVFARTEDIRNILGFELGTFTSYEVSLEKNQDISVYDDYLYQNVVPSEYFNFSIEELWPNIFQWVYMQETNEQLIMVLLLIVSVINMITVFFILVMEKVQVIGLFKALGALNRDVRRIFILLAGRILFFGILIGNGLALVLGYLQQRFQLITLDESEYYISHVPIEFNFSFILMINGIVLIVCVLFMFLPALVISRIRPSKTLRFA
ncbi:FtsX-like permease family protein [Membranicola marinus]|uniref:FtsX-like permease family protein n=1 Tax=Membranihabitans marinus TaxID=1227546 RepID=A0A953HJY3_9BACT|nr:FtsX-like permease family protein [Membranihabitans marinus]MBY5957082.1 FtsX-like permease family protein [Membranihabitans marinus]